MSAPSSILTTQERPCWAIVLGALLQIFTPQAQALQPSKCGVPIDPPSTEQSVQGEAEIHLTLTGQTLSLRWSSMLVDLLGFNHAAQTAQERLAVKEAMNQLQVLPQRFQFGAAAECKPLGVQYESRILQSADTAVPAAQEMFLFATLQYRCAVPDRLHSVKSDWFKAFPKIHRLKIRYVLPKSQGEMLMTSSNPTLNWQER